MADISPQYQANSIESKWYTHWMNQGYFHSEVDEREPYTIVIPPPNVTGVLHMGHMLNNTIQDVLIRRARLLGKNACWVPGTDHASIATEAKVVKLLEEQGISKEQIGREAFLQHAFAWKEKYGGIILQQLQKIGASCDWDRTRFTMEDSLSDAVTDMFIDLYNKGLIYRGMRMVNWDPKAKTALSDEEVYHKERQSKLYHIRYAIENSNEVIVIATTRPETILADTAIAVNPSDPRYTHLKGKKAIVPIANRAIPIIFDDYVEVEFGTGALKVTPAHDINDYSIGQRHELPIIDMFTENGTCNTHALHYEGKDRFEVRKHIVKELEELGQIVNIEEINNKVGYSERTDAVIEPRLTYQWFLSMEQLAKPALDAVVNEDIRFYPKNLVNTYKYWMENIRDWCISRQLWWGHRIPAYFYNDNQVVVAKTKEEALQKAIEASGNPSLSLADLHQDDDVVDTWFSSWLWPISVFDGFDKTNAKAQQEIDYYYPTNALVTGPDIIFFWVARMIMAGLEIKQEIPFKDVYFTGIVRDDKRRKMSKQLGNSPDPIDLINQYGADGVRVGMLLCAPAGNDLLFDEKLCEQGKNFCNKIWNALRLIKQWEITTDENQENEVAIEWFSQVLNQTKQSLEQSYSNYRISEALKTNYSLFWGEFTDWYLEFIKPPYGQGIDQKTYDKTIEFFEELMQLLHPIMPFITEEVWHLLKDRAEREDIIVSQYKSIQNCNSDILLHGQELKEMITSIREVRAKHQLKNKEEISIFIKTKATDFISTYQALIKKLCNAQELTIVQEPVDDTTGITMSRFELYIDTGKTIDIEQEQEQIVQEINYLKGFLQSVEKKLSNERFVQNAPAPVIEKERKKQTDALVKLNALEQRLVEIKS